ncbi:MULTISPECIES: DUF1236 domain-containing protein [unclassified Rhizobium]|uniref:DUF1236 domain-containing protein n=1 Tax=unclassified Rhizobium TaxID=2613769 RepID=UPI00161929FA|nr:MULTISPECIES: DUF1236 domain-containing protein [unclassified Rhizobium]MBB3319263.1 hypothetical protein [Rhizobium sp. BK181]MBB3543000.1 hypothetical protein [Rhizobium sp. BK399]MCS4094927.1 hypothetical protein [Rhizobium sp. BK176]
MKVHVTAAIAAMMLSVPAMAQTTVVTVPGEVRTYITEQEVPSVTYDGDIVVGTELPSSIEVHTIPSNDAYAYTVINKQRVIVDPHTHRVIEVIN